MGAIAELRRKDVQRTPADRGPGRDLWDRTFGTTKEDGKGPAPSRPIPGGSYGRSISGSDAALKRLIQALRSMAPGGWSDDRFTESQNFTGVVYAAIDRICKQLQQAEFQVFKKDRSAPDGKRAITPDDPPEGGRFCKPYDLVSVLERPNNQDSFGLTMYRWGQQLRLTGMALTWMVPNQFGVPMELYCMPTAQMIPQPAINPDYPDGYWRVQPIYPYGPFSSYPTPSTSVGAALDARWVLRFLYPHPLLRYDGFSPLTGLNLQIDEINQIERSRWYKMLRTFNPNVVVDMESVEGMSALPEPEVNRIRTELENMFTGTQNAGGVVISPPGSKLSEFGTNPKDMDYVAGWEQIMSFVMGAGFGITKPAAGMIEDSSYSTLFATLKQLHLITLAPECQELGSQLTRHLAPFYGDDLIVEIRCPRIDDHDVKNAKLNILIQGKAITKGELRKELEMPLWGDKRDDEIAGEGEAVEEADMGLRPDQEREPLTRKPANHRIKPANADMEQADGSAREEPLQVTQTRPRPGNLGRGALGPRKSIKRLVASVNGNGRH